MDRNPFPRLAQLDSMAAPKQSRAFLSLLFLTILKIFSTQSSKCFRHCRKMKLDRWQLCPVTPRPRREETWASRVLSWLLHLILIFSSYTASSLHSSFPDCNQERGVDRETPGMTQKVCGVSGGPASNNDPQTQSLDKPRVPCLNQRHVSWADEYDSHREEHTCNHWRPLSSLSRWSHANIFGQCQSVLAKWAQSTVFILF